MGKNKNKKKNKKADEGIGAQVPGTSNKLAVPDIASGVTTSSSFTSRDSSPIHRTLNVFSESPTTSFDAQTLEQTKSPELGDKRDSVISNTWEGRKHSLASILEPVTPRPWGYRPRRWWPCRTYRWIKDFFAALGRACAGPRWFDVFLTACLAATAIFAGYIAIELGLSILKTASAQDTASDTGCSVVYVTVPGPVITVSLVNTSPPNPARATYYFSVVNGTTEWMNSIAPPSQFSTLVTRTPEVTPTLSSLSTAPSSGALPSLPSGPTTTSQHTTAPSLTFPSLPSTLALTSSLTTIPPSTPSSSLLSMISSITSTITSVGPGGQTTIVTIITVTTIQNVPSGLTNTALPPAISTVLSTITSTVPNGPTTTLIVTSTALRSTPTPISFSSVAAPSSSNSLTTLTSTLPGGSVTTMTITSVVVVSQTMTGLSSSSLPALTSTAVVILTSTIPGGSVTTVVSTTLITMGPSSASLPSTLSNSAPSTRSTHLNSFTVSLPSPSNPVSTTISSALTSFSMTSVPFTASSSSLDPSQSSSSSPPSSTSISGTSSSVPSSSRFLWPSSSAPFSSSLSSSATPSSSSPSSSSMTTSTTQRSGTSSTGSVTSGSSATATTISTSVSSASTTVSSSSVTASTNLSLPSTSNTVSTSISTSTTTGGVPGITSPSMFSTLMPPRSMTSSSSSIFTSSLSSSSSTSFLRSSVATRSASQTTSSSGPNAPSSSNTTPVTTITSSVDGSMTVQTSTPSLSVVPTQVSGASSSQVRGMTTRIVAYSGTSFSFVFPTPDITTTVSYWTGVYPSVTGPLPSELQTVVPTTRSTTQFPVSAHPSFALFSSRSRSFRTAVTTIYDEGPDKRDVKRDANPQILPSLLTTTVQVGTPTSAQMSAVDLPGPTSCGESGNFTLNFDDTTVSSTGDQVLQASGLKNPYHHLFYANGYTNVPDKWEPYPANSQPNVAMFLPLTGRLLPNSPFAGSLLPGELGAGPRASVDSYWFNAYSGYFGCALSGLTPCLLRISGFRYDATVKTEVLVAEQNATLPACPLYIGCRLTQVSFNEQFRALSGIQFNAFTAGLGIPQVHILDDLQLEWYNNTCSAGIQRIGHR